MCTTQYAYVEYETAVLQAHRRMKADAEWEALEEKLKQTAPGWKDTKV
jgi:hypothetical protein